MVSQIAAAYHSRAELVSDFCALQCRLVELNWRQDHTVSSPGVGHDTKTLKATCTPCQHFSGRAGAYLTGIRQEGVFKIIQCLSAGLSCNNRAHFKYGWTAGLEGFRFQAERRRGFL